MLYCFIFFWEFFFFWFSLDFLLLRPLLVEPHMDLSVMVEPHSPGLLVMVEPHSPGLSVMELHSPGLSVMELHSPDARSPYVMNLSADVKVARGFTREIAWRCI